jgi:hypothetical protein
MFRVCFNDVWYHSWESFKKAWNDAVRKGELFDENGRKITKLYE